MAEHICIESDSALEALALRLRERSKMQHILLAGNRRSGWEPGPPRPHAMHDWENCPESTCKEDREATRFAPTKAEARA